MPMYEFYCARCHTLYTFWSKRVNTTGVPPCPHDARHRLQRQVSPFAVVSAGGEKKGDEGSEDLPVDEARMERAMESLASEAEGIDEEDPRAAARLMRRLSDMAGVEYGESMQEALRRLEAGEDPDAIEAEMGDLLEDEEDPFIFPGTKKGGRGRRRRPPRRDETLYEM
ncbi:MAG: zinc ribbon domain-containing protein [Candidatus Latescibacterota bacterium]